MSIRPLVRAFAATLLATSSLATFAASGRSDSGSVTLRPGVVVDGAHAIAYVMHPEGGIEALDLQHGTPLWRSRDAERPLALSGSQLIAQARPGDQGELRIVALDVQSNGVRRSEADLPMPAGIRADAVETMQQFFHVRAAPTAQGVVVSWDSELRPNLVPRTLGRIDLSAVSTRSGAKRTAWGGWQGNALFDPQAGRLMPLDDVQAQIFAASLKSTTALLSPPDATERVFTSVDGQYRLTSRPGTSKDANHRYSWTISEVSSGRVLGTIDSRVSMAPFSIVGNQVIHVAMPRTHGKGAGRIDLPLRLRAVDLTTGSELWSRELRDPEFRGPTPD